MGGDMEMSESPESAVEMFSPAPLELKRFCDVQSCGQFQVGWKTRFAFAHASGSCAA